MSAKKVVDAIVAELFRRIDSFPWGTRGRLHRRLKVNKNFFSRWKHHPERVRLLPLTQVLEFLEIHPAEFFATVLDPDNSAEPSTLENGDYNLPGSFDLSNDPGGFTLTTPLPSGEPPDAVQKVLRRFKEPLVRSSPRTEIEGRFDLQQLSSLDELRWNNTGEANRLLEQALEESPLEILADVLLVYGSTFLQLDQLSDARWAFFGAESIAQAIADRSTLALAFHKRAKVEEADGNFSEALSLLRFAGGTFNELGDFGKVARVLVSTAYHYANRGMDREAIGCAEIALDQIPNDDHWVRAGSFQLLARCLCEIGEQDAALENLEKARQLLPHCPKGAAVRFAWLEASVKKGILSVRERADLLGRAAEFFLENGEILDGALATLEHAKCLVLLHETGMVQEIARKANALAFAAEEIGERGRIASTALMLVYRAGIEGAVTEAVLSAAIGSARKAAGSPAAFYYS